MSTTTIVVLMVGLAAVAVVALIYYQKRRSEKLQRNFGPEYQRAVREYGDRRKPKLNWSDVPSASRNFLSASFRMKSVTGLPRHGEPIRPGLWMIHNRRSGMRTRSSMTPCGLLATLLSRSLKITPPIYRSIIRE